MGAVRRNAIVLTMLFGATLAVGMATRVLFRHPTGEDIARHANENLAKIHVSGPGLPDDIVRRLHARGADCARLADEVNGLMVANMMGDAKSQAFVCRERQRPYLDDVRRRAAACAEPAVADSASAKVHALCGGGRE